MRKIVQDFNSLIPYFEKLNLNGILPKIELDIMKSKLQDIYDSLNEIELIPASKTISHEENSKVEEVKVVPNQEKKAEKLIQIEEPQKIKKEPEPFNDIKHVNIPVADLHSGKEILAEKFKKSQPQINELLAQSLHKKDLSSVMQTKSIKDIEAAVDINERFQFVRELFNGDNELYSKTIKILNSSANFNEAFNYIHQNFTWNLEHEIAQKLLDLVRRRYIIEEE